MKLMRRPRRETEDWLPTAPIRRLRDEINRLFDYPFGEWPAASEFYQGWCPCVDVYDEKDNIVVKAELPGMKKEEINVSLHDNTLSISGERKREEERREGEKYRSERYFGRFQRTVPLPESVDPNRVDADFKDGVLTVTLPKTEEAKRKAIEVKVT